MQGIDEIQRDFVQAFNEIDDWMMQYEFLLQIGSVLEPYPENKKTDEYLIRGCQSKVWIFCEDRNDRIHIWGDSEALIVKGIISVAIVMFQDQPLDEVAEASVYYISDTELKNQISTDRFQGVHSVISSIQRFAKDHI